MVMDAGGRIWLANIKGLIEIDPEVNYTPPDMRITDILVNGQVKESLNSTGLEGLTLGKSENNLTFRFSRADCGSPESVWMEYRLEGYDKGWRTLQGKGEVSYYDLPPGHYVFKVRRLLDDASMATVEVRITNIPLIIGGISGFIFLVGAFLAYKYRKRLLAGLSAFLKKQGEAQNRGTSEEEQAVQEAEFKRIAVRVRQYMEEEKPYLNVDFKQSDLAAATGYSIYLLSRMFNLYLKTGYYDFVNAYRVEEFKRLVDKGLYNTYTVKTLAEKCGFKSQASFFRTFKKCTGMTPTSYINRAR